MNTIGNFSKKPVPLKCCVCVCVCVCEREREREREKTEKKRENSDFNQGLFTSQETLANIWRYFWLSHLGGGGVLASRG